MERNPAPKTCYRFAGYTVSTARRQLLRDGAAVPLVPRYFDLLLLLLERRHEAVHRREILERVWTDVVVSDGALSQAVRTLRRALGDDPRTPAFIRTVSRHGYQFVHPAVAEEPEGLAPVPPALSPAAPLPVAPLDPFEVALGTLLAPARLGDDDERREAAETLHALGTEEALRRLDERAGHERARALLRDARWGIPGAGPVPLLGRPGAWRSILHLVALRLRTAARLAGSRWGSASLGGAAAGVVAGLVGGFVLRIAPGSDALLQTPLVFACVGAALGGIGAAGVGAGMAVAEALARSFRGAALIACGALGGGFVGAVAHVVGGSILEGLFGRDLSAVGGGIEGFFIGGAAGLGYALSTPRPEGGMATPRGAARWITSLVTGIACAIACIALTWSGRRLGGVSLDLMAHSFPGSHVGLSSLGRLVGEDGVGPRARTLLGAYEGLLFGAGLAYGLTRRPHPPRNSSSGRC